MSRKIARARRPPSRLKRPEFSKILAVWAIIAASLSAAASYILAALDKQTASDVTTAIFSGCIAYLVTYAAKSATEKISRNRHGLDADGNPINQNDTEA